MTDSGNMPDVTLRALLGELGPDFRDPELADNCRRLAARYVYALMQAGVDVRQPETWIAFYVGVTAFEHALQHGASSADAGSELTLVAAFRYQFTSRRGGT